MRILSLLLAALLALCGPAQAQFSSSGFGILPAFPDVTVSLVSGGVTRTALLHLPAGYSSTARYPLVLAFHGEGGTSAGFETTTGFTTVADNNSFIVVYPEMNGTSWTTTLGGADITFINALITQLESTYSINAARIFAVGFSNGGGMARTMACQSSPTIAGMADISEEMSSGAATACSAPQTVPMLIMHGTCDPVSPYEYGDTSSGSGAAVYSAQATVQFWLTKLGCTGGSAVWNPEPAQPTNGTVPANQQPAGCPYGKPDPMTVSVTSADGVISYPTAGADISLPADSVVYSDGTTVSTTDISQTWGVNGASTCSANSHLTFVTIGYGGHEWPGNYPPGTSYGYASKVYTSTAIWQAISH